MSCDLRYLCGYRSVFDHLDKLCSAFLYLFVFVLTKFDLLGGVGSSIWKLSICIALIWTCGRFILDCISNCSVHSSNIMVCASFYTVFPAIVSLVLVLVGEYSYSYLFFSVNLVIYVAVASLYYLNLSCDFFTKQQFKKSLTRPIKLFSKKMYSQMKRHYDKKKDTWKTLPLESLNEMLVSKVNSVSQKFTQDKKKWELKRDLADIANYANMLYIRISDLEAISEDHGKIKKIMEVKKSQ